LWILSALVMGIGSAAAAQCAMYARAAGDPPAATETPAPPAMRQPQGGCGAPAGCRMTGGPMGLSEDQQKAIQKIRSDGRDAMLSARKEMMRLRNAMQGEMLKDEIDAGAIRKLVERMGDLRTQMQLQRLDQRLAIRKLLTPEQRDRAMLRQGHRGGSRPGGMRGMHRMMGQRGCMGGPGGCMPGSGWGPMGREGCPRMQAPPQGKDSGALPEEAPQGNPAFDLGFVYDPDLDVLAAFDLGFQPDFDPGFDEDGEWVEAPEAPAEPRMP